MEIKKFAQEIEKYKRKDIYDFNNLDIYINSIGNIHWDLCSEMITEKRVMNIPVGSYYEEGTIKGFINILRSAENNNLDLSNNKLSIKLLYEEPREFKVFLI